MHTVLCDTCGKFLDRPWWKIQKNNHHFCSKFCHYNYGDWAAAEKQYGGQIKKGQDIGRVHGIKYIWLGCASCGTERWVQIKHGKPSSLKCRRCNTSPEKIEMLRKMAWKGGRHITSNGYVAVAVPDNSPYVSMRNATTYVMEHRLIVAKSLGRCLTKDEIVHHYNGIKDDNRLENLLLVSPDTHKEIIPALQKRIRELEKHGIDVILS